MEYEPEVRPDRIRVLREWGKLTASLALILVGVEGLVRSAIALGELLDTPSFLWGLTVIAIGTGLSDAFYSVQASRRGHAVSSVANVLVAGAAPVDFTAAVPMLGTLTVVTVLLFAFMRTRLVISRWEAAVLLAVYGAFVTWVVLESLGVTAALA